MGKTFLEYRGKKLPYEPKRYNCFIKYATKYVSENRGTSEEINSYERDSILVSTIKDMIKAQDNRISNLAIDDLYKELKGPIINRNSQYVITLLVNFLADYIFGGNISERVAFYHYVHNYTAPVDNMGAAKMLVDFLNFVLKECGYDRIYTLDELEKKYEVRKHKKDLEELKEFIYSVHNCQMLYKRGQKINHLYRMVADDYGIKPNPKNGQYFYTLKRAYTEHTRHADYSEGERFSGEIGVMAYAYERAREKKKPLVLNRVIRNRIKEMKQR